MLLPVRIFLLLPLLAFTASAAEPLAEDLKFFASKVRPVPNMTYYMIFGGKKSQNPARGAKLISS